MSTARTRLGRQNNSPYLRVMEETGFYSRAKPTEGVIESRSLRGRQSTPDLVDKSIKYGPVVTELKARAVFELSGAPCIYFAELPESNPDPAALARLHNVAWNHGLAPILWVVTPTEIRLYNCYSKPQFGDDANLERHLLGLFEQTEQGLRELNEFAGRLQIETGAFWQDERTQAIDRGERVDASLLDDLERAEDKLVRATPPLDRATAHALLSRSIFVAYLQDRGILPAGFLAQRFGARNFAEILGNKSATYELFEWVQNTFNGNLFPLLREGVHERDRVDEEGHLGIVQRLFAGTQMATGQRRLWPYNFKVIPIELISSIYEKFAHAGDPAQAKARSTHYTPTNLVDLTLSEVFRSLPGEANILDLSCGSGVFLVEAFRRLVARQIASGRPRTRKLIRDVLYQQLYGLDISDEAVQIAAFSLYLTALELDPKPEPPEALKFEPLIGRNLFVADAFDEGHEFNSREPFAHRGFSAIVGNPPWKRSAFTASALAYCERHSRPLSRNNPDQAFLWRAGDFATEATTLGLILHGRPFFSHTPEAAKTRSELLATYSPTVLVNLANLRNSGLFPNAKAPAMILVALARPPEPGEHCYLVCPEEAHSFSKHGIIEIGQENVKRLPIIRAAGNQDVLKIASWGSPRDDALIQRLSATFPTLDNLLQSKKKVWFPGQGYQDVAGAMDASDLYLKPWLESGVMPRYHVDPDRLPRFTKRKLHRTRKAEIYRGPVLLTTRGITEDGGFFAAISPRDVVYTEEYYGIAIPPPDSRYLHYLNGIFNSNLAPYYLFLTGSVWGVERDKVEPNDIKRFPIPRLSEDSQVVADRILAVEAELRKFAGSFSSARHDSLRNQLNDAVYDLYGLSEEERERVNETVSYALDLFSNGPESVALQSPTKADVQGYADEGIRTLQPFLDTLGERTITADIFVAAKSTLQVVKFSLVTPLSHRSRITVHELPALAELLDRVARQLPNRIAPALTTRRTLRIYTHDAFYVVKPNQIRYWTRSAAMDDADRIIADHLRAAHDSSE